MALDGKPRVSTRPPLFDRFFTLDTEVKYTGFYPNAREQRVLKRQEIDLGRWPIRAVITCIGFVLPLRTNFVRLDGLAFRANVRWSSMCIEKGLSSDLLKVAPGLANCESLSFSLTLLPK